MSVMPVRQSCPYVSHARRANCTKVALLLTSLSLGHTSDFVYSIRGCLIKAQVLLRLGQTKGQKIISLRNGWFLTLLCSAPPYILSVRDMIGQCKPHHPRDIILYGHSFHTTVPSYLLCDHA